MFQTKFVTENAQETFSRQKNYTIVLIQAVILQWCILHGKVAIYKNILGYCSLLLSDVNSYDVTGVLRELSSDVCRQTAPQSQLVEPLISFLVIGQERLRLTHNKPKQRSNKKASQLHVCILPAFSSFKSRKLRRDILSSFYSYRPSLTPATSKHTQTFSLFSLNVTLHCYCYFRSYSTFCSFLYLIYSTSISCSLCKSLKYESCLFLQLDKELGK